MENNDYGASMAMPKKVVLKRDRHGRAISKDADISANVHLSHNVTIYPGVRIGKGCRVMENAVLGRLPMNTASSTRPVRKNFGALLIGEGTLIGPNAVVYTDCMIGANTMIAEMVSLREGARIGEGVILGRGVKALYNCTVGNFTRIHDLVHLVGDMVIEEHVFMGVGIAMANDPDIYLSRFKMIPLCLRPPTVRKYAVIAGGVTLNPGVQIGKGAMVGAGSVVTHDVPAWTIVAGVPARELRAIPPEWRDKILQHEAAAK